MPGIGPAASSLAERDGLPDDLLRLRKAYPRETWAEHANLGEWVRFWLDRHGMFREVGAMLTDGGAQWRQGQIDAREFAPWLAPRLQFYFGHLDLHHRIEEFHIFPAFARAEPSLQHGFALLEADHQAIHALVDNLQGAAAPLFAGEQDDSDLLRRAGDATAAELTALVQSLAAHLADEEDLIVPIVLDRGEAVLGLF